MDDLTKQGIQAYRSGDRNKARQLFLLVVKQNPNSESAWGWLYKVSKSKEEHIYCIEQVLRINPENIKANQIHDGLISEGNPQDSIPQPQITKFSQPALDSNSDHHQIHKKKSVLKFLIIGVFVLSFLCVSGYFLFSIFKLLNDRETETSAHILTAVEEFEVSAIHMVKTDGYTITSEVCEVVSSEKFQPMLDIGYDGKIVFHAFRLAGPNIDSEYVVLFFSNHTAADGYGITVPVNADAISLYPTIINELTYPINLDTDGAWIALDCAYKAAGPPSLEIGKLDVENWRKTAIEKYGEEYINADGSKDDYVLFALSICKQDTSEREAMEANLGAKYQGSFQQFVIETFCIHLDGN